MTAKMWIECLIMLMTMCGVFFAALLAGIESLCQRLQWKGKWHGVVEIVGDCCFVGLNVCLGGMVSLILAWVFAAIYEFFTR